MTAFIDVKTNGEDGGVLGLFYIICFVLVLVVVIIQLVKLAMLYPIAASISLALTSIISGGVYLYHRTEKEEIKEEKEKIFDLKGHQLIPNIISKLNISGVICNNCQFATRQDNESYGCRVCNVDYCNKCLKELKSPEEIIV
jgi:hypothetical protein